MTRPRGWLVAALLLLGSAAGADAQVFLASRPHPEFMVGPLFVRAALDPALGQVPVDVLFSLVVPPTRSALEMEQDLFLLWPGAITPEGDPGQADPALQKEVESLGFTLIGHGHVATQAQSLYLVASEGRMGASAPSEVITPGAAFVSFVRENGMGLSPPGTLIRIPWTPRLANRAWLIGLRLLARGLVKPKPATWVERTLWGPRYHLALGFHDVRQREIFPLYFWNRDRVIRLSEDPSQLIASFAESSRLKIDAAFPESAQRQLSESLEDTLVVSLFLDRTDGIVPQVLAVDFGYFSGLQSWAPILIPIAFFLLGNLAAPLVRAVGESAGRAIASRVHIGRRDRAGAGRESGTIATRETLARIVPGETLYEDVLRLLGPRPEEQEQLAAPRRRVLIYRGRRVVPQWQRRFWLLATVRGWDVEQHEVEVTVDDGVVSDVQARVRRTHPANPAGD
jgi:hypothetical protein